MYVVVTVAVLSVVPVADVVAAVAVGAELLLFLLLLLLLLFLLLVLVLLWCLNPDSSTAPDLSMYCYLATCVLKPRQMHSLAGCWCLLGIPVTLPV